MNTLIIEHVDQSTTQLLQQLVEKLGLSVKTKKEKKEKGVITNPELLRRIEAYETGKVKPIEITLDDIKKLIDEKHPV